MIANELLKLDEEILVVDKSEFAIYQLRTDIKKHKNLKALVLDLSNRDCISRLSHYPIDRIFHTAAMKHVTFCEDCPALATKNNIFGTNNLINYAKSKDVEHFINVSTDKSAYPVNIMGATKFIAEKIVTNAGYKSVRLGNILNSNGSIIPTIRKFVEAKQTLDITDFNATRFYVTPHNTAKFIIDAAYGKYKGNILIDKIPAASLKTMLDVTFDMLGDSCDYKVVGLRPGEKLHEHLFSKEETAHMQDHGSYWGIDHSYVNKNNNIQVIDSSGFCVGYDKFYSDLQSSLQ